MKLEAQLSIITFETTGKSIQFFKSQGSIFLAHSKLNLDFWDIFLTNFNFL